MVKPSPSSQPQPDRLREHPEQRFAGADEKFDLNEAIRNLHAEPSGQRGHKQINLFKHGAATLALYHFDQGAKLDDHTVDGPVIIHVLNGRLIVRADGRQHELGPNELLRFAPGVCHSVEAREHTEMLLTICVAGPGSHS